jgi:ArsR family transcriptional regulator
MRSPFTTGFTDTAAAELAAAVTVLADPTRLKILALLAANGELTITDLVHRLGTLQQPTVSHHVKTLARAGLLTKRTQGVFTYCAADLRAVAALVSALNPWQAS